MRLPKESVQKKERKKEIISVLKGWKNEKQPTFKNTKKKNPQR